MADWNVEDSKFLQKAFVGISANMGHWRSRIEIKSKVFLRIPIKRIQNFSRRKSLKRIPGVFVEREN